MKKQIRWMSAALAACTLLAAGGAPAFAADSGREHNYTILLETTGDTDFMWFPEMEAMRFEQDGKYGLKKLDGTVVLPAEYSKIENEFGNYNDEGYVTVFQNGRVGVADREGEIILNPEWKSVSYGEGLMTVLSTDNQYGFADYNGNIVIEPQYDAASVFSDGFVSVGKDLKYSYIDAENNLLVPWQDKELDTWDGKYFSINDYDTDTVKIIDGTGKVITDNEYKRGARFLDGKVASVRRKSDNKSGVIDPQNRAIIPFVYDSVRTCRLDENDPADVVFAATAEDKVTFFDLNGNRLGEETWDKGQMCGDTVGEGILVEKNGKVGMIDMTGKVIAEPVYDEIEGSSYNRIAFIYQNGKVGVIDTRDGAVLVEPRWKQIPQYDLSVDGYTSAYVGSRPDGSDWDEVLLDDKGQIVIAPDETGSIQVIGNGYLYLNEYSVTMPGPDGGTGREWLAKINDTIVPRGPGVLDADETEPDEKVQYLADNGVLRGDKDGELHLYDRVTRAEFVTLLSRAENWDLDGVQAGSFTDVLASHWAAQAIEKAAALGVVNGVGGGQFDPDGWVTEGQALTILNRCAGYAEEVETEGALETADAAGLTEGLREYGLYDPANRLFSCHVLYNYLHLDSAA